MLVCPHCQFDNPNSNLFCQNCGESLTFHPCHECGEKVPFSEAICHRCGALTGFTWWAIVAGDDPEAGSLPSGAPDYLDIGQRYRLEKPPARPGEEIPDRQARVFDCQPLQKSVLKVLLEDRSGPRDLDLVGTDGEPAPDWLPKAAVPYLRLKDFYPAVPELHETWREGDREVILLDDRSGWPTLSETIARENPPILQLIYWFDEIAKLWKALADVGCCRSVLVKSNLRVDEDRAIGVQQLIADRADSPPDLRDLAVLWKDFLPGDRDPLIFALRQFLERLRAGEIDSVAELRLQLQELGDEEASFPEEEALALQEAIEESIEFMSDDTSAAIGETEETTSPSNADLTSIIADEEDEHATDIAPTRLLTLADAGATDTGRTRRHNEDCFGINTDITRQQTNRSRNTRGRGLYIVCDGMGGHASGEVASSLAVKTLQEFFSTRADERMPGQEVIEEGIRQANQALYQVNQAQESYGSGRMGTTLVLALVRDTTVAIAHVGDSRIYQVNRRGMEQLTVDHEVGQRAIQEGIPAAIAYSRPDAYQLTQALGPHDHHYIKPDIRIFEVREDTLFLLCSDGLSDNELIEKNWQTHLSPLLSSSANLEEGVRELIDLANQQNGHDNITAVLVRIKVQAALETLPG